MKSSARPAIAGSRLSKYGFLRLRPPASMGRTWNMTMTGLLASHEKTAAMPGM